MSRKKNNQFYVVTAGKDVGVFKLWLQAAGVVVDSQCEGFETQEAAIEAFDESFNNGLIRITGSCASTYKSPRLHPPVTSPPFPKLRAPVQAPLTPPTSPVYTRSIQATDFDDNQSFGAVPGYPMSPPLNVTIRSPKRERLQSNRSPQKRAAGSSQTHHSSSRVSPKKREQQKTANGAASPPQHFTAVQASNETESESEPECVSVTPRRMRTLPSLPSTPRAKVVAVAYTKSASQTLSPPVSTLPSKREPGSPAQYETGIAIDPSDEESYPEGSETETETESSGPEDVTPPRPVGLLLSPLTSPKLISPDLTARSPLAETVPDTHLIGRSSASSSPRVPKSPTPSMRQVSYPSSPIVFGAAALGMSQPSHVPNVVHDVVSDPRSPVQKGRVLIPGEPK
ncbi:hypothetical protein D9757_000608 [Collybiopsis confluens]|uniref:Uncharacterized protein n=1 Tax=Collybiopsis confluens TaxID=2823264 RepID=A0A8H5MGS4_9AGAR|nr:hypothetical protein D9757_000608 [Collybiopsis confluens]